MHYILQEQITCIKIIKNTEKYSIKLLESNSQNFPHIILIGHYAI